MLIGIPASGIFRSVTVTVSRPGLYCPVTLTTVSLSCAVPVEEIASS